MFPGNLPPDLITVTDFPHSFEIIEHNWIPLSDGTRLAARIWLPEGVSDRPVPAVLEYIPYHIRDGRRDDDDLIHPFFAGHSIAGVRVDIRGSGNSEGLLHDEYLKQEHDDALEVIAWLAAQPWCNGNVGMMGLSWGGFNSLQVAARQPEALKAIIAVGATVDRYNDDVHYKQGCLLNENFGWGSSFMSFNSRPPDPDVVGDDWRKIWLDRLENLPFLPERWLSHQSRDDYWRHGSVCEDYSAIQCPVMIVTGWGDAYVNAVPRLLENLTAPCRAIAGPWAHQYPHLATPGPAIDFLGEAVSWWRQWLTGDAEATPTPQYRAFRSEAANVDQWENALAGQWLATSWDTGKQNEQLFYLTDHSLKTEPGSLTPQTVKSPVDCGITGGEFIPHCKGPEMPVDQRIDDGRSVTFDTEVLTEPLDIWGDATLRLRVRSDRPVAQLIARLCDIGPDGRSSRVTVGVLNLTHRNSQTNPEPMPINEEVDITIKFDHVCHRFLPGHRLRLALSTTYWPMIWPILPNPTLIISGPATLSIPHPASVTPVSMPPPRAPAANTTISLEPPQNERRVNIDIRQAKTTVDILDYYGKSRYLDHGLTTSGRKEEQFAIQWADSTSATHNLHWRQTVARGDWSTATHLIANMSIEEDHYLLRLNLWAMEGEMEIFHREWRSQVLRSVDLKD